MDGHAPNPYARACYSNRISNSSTTQPRASSAIGITEKITTLAAFDALEPDWNRIHASDKGANVFSSWAWLKGWLSASSYEWFILGLRPAQRERYVAFLALSVKRGSAWRGLRKTATLSIAGHPITNHTGLIASPGYEHEAVAAFGRHLQRENWQTLNFQLVADPRLLQLSRHLNTAHTKFSVGHGEHSPVLELGGSWEDYLDRTFSAKSRRELRRRQRKADALGLRFSFATPETFEQHLAALLELHQQRFGPLAERHRRLYQSLFCSTFEAGLLHLNMLWHGDNPVSAQVGFLDAKHHTYHGCQGGWDAAYSDLAPGLLCKLEAIRYAYRQGFTTFDLGRGANEYKFSLGAKPVTTTEIKLKRPGWRQRLRQAARFAVQPNLD